VCCCGGAGVRRGVGCEVRCVVVEVLESVQELGDREANAHYVEELLDDVEALSDSDVDMDTISVRSTPKPKLRYESKVVIVAVFYVRVLSARLVNNVYVIFAARVCWFFFDRCTALCGCWPSCHHAVRCVCILRT